MKTLIPPAQSKRCCLCLLLFLFSVSGFSQVDSARRVNKPRLRALAIGGAAAYGITLAGLNHLWYADTRRQSFRFFNDNAEWKQVDKLGHFYSSFYFSYGTSRALQACRVPVRKADLWGALTGFAVLVPVEIFDGFSDAYGASTGDLIADAAGSAFYLGQSYLWNEVRIHPKFSFHRTDYAPQRPNTLGIITVKPIGYRWMWTSSYTSRSGLTWPWAMVRRAWSMPARRRTWRPAMVRLIGNIIFRWTLT
jgi:hypothetical protein